MVLRDGSADFWSYKCAILELCSAANPEFLRTAMIHLQIPKFSSANIRSCSKLVSFHSAMFRDTLFGAGAKNLLRRHHWQKSVSCSIAQLQAFIWILLLLLFRCNNRLVLNCNVVSRQSAVQMKGRGSFALNLAAFWLLWFVVPDRWVITPATVTFDWVQGLQI